MESIVPSHTHTLKSLQLVYFAAQSVLPPCGANLFGRRALFTMITAPRRKLPRGAVMRFTAVDGVVTAAPLAAHDTAGIAARLMGGCQLEELSFADETGDGRRKREDDKVWKARNVWMEKECETEKVIGMAKGIAIEHEQAQVDARLAQVEAQERQKAHIEAQLAQVEAHAEAQKARVEEQQVQVEALAQSLSYARVQKKSAEKNDEEHARTFWGKRKKRGEGRGNLASLVTDEGGSYVARMASYQLGQERRAWGVKSGNGALRRMVSCNAAVSSEKARGGARREAKVDSRSVWSLGRKFIRAAESTSQSSTASTTSAGTTSESTTSESSLSSWAYDNLIWGK